MSWFDEVRGSEVDLGKRKIAVPEGPPVTKAEVLERLATIELILATIAPHQAIVADGKALIKGFNTDLMESQRIERVGKK